jgi:hypothetical protein
MANTEKFYLVKDSLPGLSGLHVRGYMTATTGRNYPRVEVVEIITNAVVGDRDVKFQIPRYSLWINPEHLTEVDDITHEYTTKNDYGEFRYEGRLVQGTLQIVYAKYDNAITVTVIETSVEPSKTLYSKTFYDDHDRVLDVLVGVICGVNDPDDVILALKELEDN